MFRHLIHLSCVLLSLACILPTYSADAEIRRVFNVPAGPAEQSLKLFSEQSGRGVIFSTDSLKDARTKAVQGEFTAREAVDRMVDGTVLVVTPDEKTGAFAIKRDSDPNAERAAPTVPGGRPGNGAKTEPRPVQRDAKDEAITLSPFTVNASSDTGYLATSTLSGSRLNTPLKDTAATINVLTAEFLADVGATDLTKALQWGNNVQPNLADTAALGAAGNDNNFFQERTTFRVRGIGATTMRNYFDWKMPVDNYNIDRIEESHGPNSILFGIGSAGGIINLSTKQANFQQSFRRASADVGSFGGYRGTLDVNQALLDGRLGVRVNAFYDHAGSFRTYGFEDKQAIHLAVIYRPTPHTRVRIEYEKGDQNEILASYGLFDGVSTWLAAGRPAFSTNIAANPALGIGRFGTAARVTYIENNHSLINMAARNFGPTGGTAVSRLILDPALADPNINGGGPGQLRHTYFDTYSAFIERRFGKSTYLELAYTRQDQNARLYRLDAGTADGGALSFDPNLTLATGATNPNGGRLMLDGNWRRVRTQFRGDFTRLTGSTEFDFGKWGRYRLATMGEYQYSVVEGGSDLEAWIGRPFNPNPESAANLVFRRNYVTERVWSTYYHNGPGYLGLIQNMTDPVTGRTLSSSWVRRNDEESDPSHQATILVGGQARYFNDRLIVGFGFRRDELDQTLRNGVRDPVTNEFGLDWTSSVDSSSAGRTKTLGTVAHLTRNISFLYNQSDNFSLPGSTRILPNSRPGGTPEGQGKDIGIAVTLLDGKLYGRAVYYKSNVAGSTGAHGFGTNITSPANVSDNVLNALLGAGLITQPQADARRVTANGIQFDRTSEGVELNLVANPTKDWRLQVNYSYTDSFEENIGAELQAWANDILPFFKQFDQNIPAGSGTIASVIADFESAMRDQFALEGVNVGGNRRQKVSFFSRYSFSWSPLRGLFVGGGYRHQSKAVAGRDGPQGELQYGRSFWLADAVVGYRFRNVPVLKRLSTQLNVYNLFDDDRLLVTSKFDDGSVRRGVPIAPRTWRLSANFDF